MPILNAKNKQKRLKQALTLQNLKKLSTIFLKFVAFFVVFYLIGLFICCLLWYGNVSDVLSYTDDPVFPSEFFVETVISPTWIGDYYISSLSHLNLLRDILTNADLVIATLCAAFFATKNKFFRAAVGGVIVVAAVTAGFFFVRQLVMEPLPLPDFHDPKTRFILVHLGTDVQLLAYQKEGEERKAVYVGNSKVNIFPNDKFGVVESKEVRIVEDTSRNGNHNTCLRETQQCIDGACVSLPGGSLLKGSCVVDIEQVQVVK